MSLSKEIDKKIDLVNNLSRDMGEFGSFLVFEYSGLNSSETTTLRRNLRKSSSKLVVHKNNILNRALKQKEIEVGFELKGANAILFTKNDIAPFQEIVKLSKEKSSVSLKLAYFEGEVIKDKDLQVISSLSSKEVLFAKLARSLMMPVYKLAFMMKSLGEQK